MSKKSEFYANEFAYYSWQLELLGKSQRNREKEIEEIQSYLLFIISKF